MGQSSGWLKPASSQAPGTEEWVQIVRVDRLVKGCGHWEGGLRLKSWILCCHWPVTRSLCQISHGRAADDIL